MRVVVCGSRTWRRYQPIVLRLAQLLPLSEVIIGGAPGADRLADEAAVRLRLDRIVCYANWQGRRKRAGHVRNARMLSLEPELVIAFRAAGPSPGTDGLLAEARRRGIPVELHEPEE